MAGAGDNANTEDDAAFARGMASPLGKFTEPLKTYVDESTLNAWLRMAASQNKVPGELLRDLVYLVVHGKTPAELAAHDTRALLAGKGLDEVRRVMGAQ
jgi:hypothetical protein